MSYVLPRNCMYVFCVNAKAHASLWVYVCVRVTCKREREEDEECALKGKKERGGVGARQIQLQELDKYEKLSNKRQN